MVVTGDFWFFLLFSSAEQFQFFSFSLEEYNISFVEHLTQIPHLPHSCHFPTSLLVH